MWPAFTPQGTTMQPSLRWTAPHPAHQSGHLVGEGCGLRTPVTGRPAARQWYPTLPRSDSRDGWLPDGCLPLAGKLTRRWD